MTWSSSASANGSGTHSDATRRTGASSSSKPSSATSEATVAPQPPWYGFSSATTSRLVRPTDARTVVASRGTRQRRSTTSTETSSAASSSAAASASGTVDARATTVTSVPGRTTAASPSGTTWSGGAGSPLLANRPLCSKNTTGSSLRIAEAMRPTTSDGVDGATTL